ncbi:MAG: type II secretion system protein GspD [Gemmatimonadaceae bacterium]|nr:type II secretion system protein GspD [Gemmatimonadaceae bacterium]
MSISFVRFHALALALIVGAPAAGVRALPAQQRPRTAPAAAATPARDATPHDSTVTVRNDSVSIRLVDADLRAAVQALAPYLDRPVVFASTLPGARVTVTTPHAVPRADVAQLLRGVLESQNLELVADTGLYRVQVKPAAPPPAAVGARATDTSRAGPVQLFVIHLRHARAADVAATVNALYGRASALGEIGAAPQPATLSQQLQANHIPPVSAPNANAVPGAAGRAATFTGDVTIVPDPRSNSLLIRASAHDFALIQAAVAELDTRPLQVLIEVVIAEVQRSWSLKFGVAASAPPGRVNGSKTTVSGSQAGPGLSDFVLNVMHLGSINLDATLSAAASKGDVKILSRPVVIAANNEPATINVGSQRPFVQVSRSLPTDAATRDQVVQYKDVGTKLTVLPTISPDGYVVLSVTQEVNNATTEVAFDAPVISTRSVQTQLLIKDGQTVALGGLTDRQKDVNQGGVPVLSSIPLLGGLFGHASRETTETELFLFLTPRVIRTDDDASSITQPYLERADKVKP